VEVSNSAASGGEHFPVSDEIERLLAQAEQVLERQATASLPKLRPFRLEEFSDTSTSVGSAALDWVPDVDLDVAIEFGRTRIARDEVAELRSGSVVPLDDLGPAPVNVFAGGHLIAKGDLLVLNDHFCVRVTELIREDRGG
jgi:flagellar motor switch protein FliN/FliY